MKLQNCPHCGGNLRFLDRDGRARMFRVRLRLYDTRSASHDDPIADSAEGAPPDQPGNDMIKGLSGVMAEAQANAHAFHGRPLRGWDEETMSRKIRSTYVTLSRTGGKARINVDYDTPESFNDSNAKPRFSARIDLVWQK